MGCLVLDQGGHSSRAMVFDGCGNVVASVAVPVSTAYPQPGFAEQDPLALLASLHRCLQQLAATLPDKELAVAESAALIVQRSSFLACRKRDLSPLTPVISWQDTRNRVLMDALESHHAFLRMRTGLRPNAHYGASKMRWLLDHNPVVQQAAASGDLLFVPLAAWLASRLVDSDEVPVDPVIASRTLLCALGSMEWDAELLALFGISAETLPAMVPSNYRFGTIALGGCVVPLALVGGDQSFVPFSCGAEVDPEAAFANIGTGAFIQTVATDLAAVDPRQLCSLAVRTESECIIMAEGTVNAASTALDWLWQQRGKSLDYRELAAAVDSVVTPPRFTNTLLGTGSPDWLPQREPEFHPQGASLAEEAAGVVESVVFALADNFFLLRKANPQLSRIIVSGGLSLLDGFCQKLSNCCGVEVLRPENAEASARGAAFYLMQKNVAGGNLGRCFVPVRAP